MLLSFTVPGKAQPSGSKRAFVRGNHAVVVDANKNAGAWKERVAIAAREAMGPQPVMEGPLKLTLTIWRLRPKSHFTPKGALRKGVPDMPTGKPDLTKLVRAIEDGMTGIVWRDDSQVCAQATEKMWSDQRDEVRITVEPFYRVAYASRPIPLFPEHVNPLSLNEVSGC